MPPDTPTLHLVCGKIAAGKSTLCTHLAQAGGTILVSEDQWLHTLYSDEMKTIADFVRCSAKLRQAMTPHVIDLLKAGLSVVLDFAANTVEARTWIRQIIAQSGADHQLHLLDPPDHVCLARLKARNAKGDHPFHVTTSDFEKVTKHFQPPTPDEGFNIVVHDVPG
ncbi:ATP-binding protein [Cognatiyoonia sp. IB215182]|uniref:AAA family ATPase n=1 Tax=Cognatiyoonia sp. IB215182 TaxID=3097353 RepID=UPI002A0E9F77|nr:ATP-binding protein [Cognatiyoonia sp. IB215182]MDX8355086.1 ATP-binding protein [Cognatiyoonia sp. IB215182]